MSCSCMYFLPSARVVGVRSRNTSNWYSERPIQAPRATAMGRPIMPVPGMPTPMAFFKMLAESNTSILSGIVPRASFALAVARATAIGSVQPMAGTTSLCIREIILSRVSLSNMKLLLYTNNEILVFLFLEIVNTQLQIVDVGVDVLVIRT